MNEIQKDVEVINFLNLKVTKDGGKRRRFSHKIAEVREVRKQIRLYDRSLWFREERIVAYCKALH